mmetsp:Transcript_29143/g.81359  ORF Transcript_29143/g.81359 Transcript_29143/m.81359 type:complete len:228 (-) Transcript_29143:79-762(-)
MRGAHGPALTALLRVLGHGAVHVPDDTSPAPSRHQNASPCAACPGRRDGSPSAEASRGETCAEAREVCAAWSCTTSGGASRGTLDSALWPSSEAQLPPASIEKRAWPARRGQVFWMMHTEAAMAKQATPLAKRMYASMLCRPPRPFLVEMMMRFSALKASTGKLLFTVRVRTCPFFKGSRMKPYMFRTCPKNEGNIQSTKRLLFTPRAASVSMGYRSCSHKVFGRSK